MYDAVMQENLWKDFMGDEVTDFIDYDYKAKLEDDKLKIHIPEKNFTNQKRCKLYSEKEL